MNRRFKPIDLMKKYGNNQNFMSYFGINLRLWLDRSPIVNYKRSRGI